MHSKVKFQRCNVKLICLQVEVFLEKFSWTTKAFLSSAAVKFYGNRPERKFYFTTKKSNKKMSNLDSNLSNPNK